MKKKTIFITILISLILIIGLPLAIDWLIIGSKFPSNIENSDWVGFFGGYIGALIGAIVSLAGIIITIRYTNEQNKKDRELQVKPYCAMRYVHDDRLVGTNKIIAELPIGCEPKENNGPKYTSIIYIKNIGLGPAVEFDFDVDEIDDGREHYLVLMQQNADTSNRSVDLLQPGEEAAFPIYIKETNDTFVHVYKKELSDGGFAICILNFGDKPCDVCLPLIYTYNIRDVWAQKNIFPSNYLSTKTMPHCTKVFRMYKTSDKS